MTTEKTQEPDINDPEVARRGTAIAIVSDWETARELDIEIADKYDLADRILEVMPVEPDEIAALHRRLQEATEVIRLAATTHPDHLWKAKEWIQHSDKKVAAP
jgi:hypothetical protein